MLGRFKPDRAAWKACLAHLADLRAQTGLCAGDMDLPSAMGAVPGGLAQHLHQDGAAINHVSMLATAADSLTAPTRFVAAPGCCAGAREAEELASRHSPPLQRLAALEGGEILVWNTRWWHAAPPQPVGSTRRTIFVPFTGARKRTTNGAPVRPRRLGV